jgi:hypothetical protein
MNISTYKCLMCSKLVVLELNGLVRLCQIITGSLFYFDPIAGTCKYSIPNSKRFYNTGVFIYLEAIGVPSKITLSQAASRYPCFAI